MISCLSRNLAPTLQQPSRQLTPQLPREVRAQLTGPFGVDTRPLQSEGDSLRRMSAAASEPLTEKTRMTLPNLNDLNLQNLLLTTKEQHSVTVVHKSAPVGARLHHFWHIWEALGASTEVTSILRDGLKWDFTTPPQLRTTPWEAQLHITQRKWETFAPVLDTLLEKGAIEQVMNPNSPGRYSILFLRPKPSGEWRPIIDLKSLNLLIVNQTFRMESARTIQRSLEIGQWACSIDLTDAYYHIPIHRNFRKFLRFAIRGKVFQFRALPFGLVIAPRIFSMVMLDIARILRENGVAIHQYLDDWLVKHLDPDSLMAQVRAILQLLELLGLLVNFKKSELVPSQKFEFVGVLYDLSEGRAYPPVQRTEKVKAMIDKFLHHDSRPGGEWLSLIGLLGSITDQVPLGQLHVRPLQFHLKTHWNLTRHARTQPVSVPDHMKTHLRWWVNSPAMEVGVPLKPFTPQETVFTDASREGWGAHWNGLEVAGTWDTAEHVHINILEMRAVRHALAHFGNSLASQNVLIATDNTTVLAYINHQGGTRSQPLMEETTRVFQVAESYQMILRARHIPGRLNVLADALSRKTQVLPTEWSLHPEVTKMIWETWWRPTIDLFATRHNRKLPLFVSPVPDEQALHVDAMTMDWNNLLVYAYPPTGLIARVITKLKQHQCRMILIAPHWTEKPWFPELLHLQVCPPLQLPPRPDLLKQPLNNLFHLKPEALNLHAWNLSPVH